VWVIAREELAAAIGMPAGDPHRELVAAQTADHSAAEESGAAEHGDDALIARRPAGVAMEMVDHRHFAGDAGRD
jgi:hypothetical protein